jgi:glycosyltransferase involved in cell wall biosynthesis
MEIKVTKRILIAGNLANTGYYLASKLREQGMQVDLLMEENPNFLSDPKSTGEIKETDYPKWIKFWKKNKNTKWQIIKIMRKYDIIGAATELPIFALFSFKPYIAISTGSDLRELAEEKSFKGKLLRMAYKKAKIVIYTDPDLKKKSDKLGLKNSVYCPPIREWNKLLKQNISTKKNNKIIFFHPTDHIWKIKRNDFFIKEYIKLAKENKNMILVIIKRGEDFEKSLNLLKEANLDEKIVVLPKPLDQNELGRRFQESDVIVDQFGVGSLGSTALEAMYSGKPVLGFILEDIYSELYGEIPPVINAKNENEMKEKIEGIVNQQFNINELGIKSKEWVSKYHDTEKIVAKYAGYFKSI